MSKSFNYWFRILSVVVLLYYVIKRQWKKAIFALIAMVAFNLVFPYPIGSKDASAPKPGDSDFIGPLPE